MYNIIYDVTSFNRLYISIKISNYDLYLDLSDTSDVSLKSKYGKELYIYIIKNFWCERTLKV